MKQHNIFIATILLSVIASLSNYAYANENNEEQRYGKWMQNVREYKQEFLTKETELSQEQQDAFFPIYNEMEQAVYDINKNAQELVKNVSTQSEISDEEYKNAAEAIVKAKEEEAKIETEYFKKFSEILSGKQLFLLKRAETRFSRNMLQHHRESQRRNH